MVSFRRTSYLLDCGNSSMDFGGTNLKYNTVLAKRTMANVRIIIPTPLRQYAGNRDAVEVEAESVHEALTDLVERHNQLRRHLFSEDGRLRNFVNVYVNEEDIRYLERDGTALKGGDTISIVPSIAGGSFSLMDRLAAKRKDVLSPSEIKRYSRHLILPEVGMTGQLKLKQSSALIIGAGGLGVPLTQYLSAAGVGRLGIVDFDVIDESNLQRQVLYGTKDVGRKKLEVAKERVAQINPNVDAEKGPCYRCLYAEPPPPGLVPSCAEGGVLGVLPGIIGSIQAIEAIKVLLGKGETLIGR